MRAEPAAPSRWLVPVLVTLGLSAVTGVSWSARAGQRAEDAYHIASGDHDSVTRLMELVPRLERALERLERQGVQCSAIKGAEHAEGDRK